jgi:hypothetical protein
MVRIVNLRPIVNRPAAGPGKLFGRSRQPGLHGIDLDVVRDPLKFRFIADQPIIALALPERLPGEPEKPVAFSGGKFLKNTKFSAGNAPTDPISPKLCDHPSTR